MKKWVHQLVFYYSQKFLTAHKQQHKRVCPYYIEQYFYVLQHKYTRDITVHVVTCQTKISPKLSKFSQFSQFSQLSQFFAKNSLISTICSTVQFAHLHKWITNKVTTNLGSSLSFLVIIICL